jgi:hypothetical protein
MIKRPSSSEVHSQEEQRSSNDETSVLCPSAQPDMQGSLAFGVVGGTVDEPRLSYLAEPQPVTEELLALSKPAKPTEVFRFAAPCAASGCKHFDGSDCRLAARTTRMIPAVVEKLPPCRLRPRCRWWRQEGKAACMRCPVVVTTIRNPTEEQLRVADPDALAWEQRGEEELDNQLPET